MAVQNELELFPLKEERVLPKEERVLPKEERVLPKEERENLSTLVVMSVVRQAGLVVDYSVEDNSPVETKQIENIAAAIRATWGLDPSDRRPDEDARAAYRVVRHLLRA